MTKCCFSESACVESSSTLCKASSSGSLALICSDPNSYVATLYTSGSLTNYANNNGCTGKRSNCVVSGLDSSKQYDLTCAGGTFVNVAMLGIRS